MYKTFQTEHCEDKNLKSLHPFLAFASGSWYTVASFGDALAIPVVPLSANWLLQLLPEEGKGFGGVQLLKPSGVIGSEGNLVRVEEQVRQVREVWEVGAAIVEHVSSRRACK